MVIKSDTICERTPAFVLPFRSMADNTYNVFGLKGKCDMILAVWALGQTEFSVDLSKYGFIDFEILYPQNRSDFFVKLKGDTLECRFENKYSACLIKLFKEQL